MTMNYFDLIAFPENAFEFAVILFFSAIKVSILLGCIYLVCRSFRRFSATTKHFVWMTGLCTGLILPFLFTVKRWEMPILPAQVSLINQQFQADFSNNVEKHKQEFNGSTIQAAPTEKSLFPTDTEIVQENKFPLRLNQISGGIIIIWLIGAIFLLFKLVIGIITANLGSRRARVVINPVLVNLAAELSQNLNLKGKVRLLSSKYIPMPVICGLWHSKVLLPESFEAWTEERQRVVLLHELAHVKRRDCLTQLLAQIVCTFYWFNPLVWYVARHLRELREQACDDYVLSVGTKPSVYAGHLLDIARSMQEKKSFFDSSRIATVAIARKSQIETRLLAILDSTQSRQGSSRFIKAGAIFAFAVIVLPLSALQFKSQQNASADTTENFSVNNQESISKTPNETENYLTLSKQYNSPESFEPVTNKKARSISLNKVKDNFDNAGGIRLDISKVQNSDLSRKESFDESENDAQFSTEKIGDKPNRLGRLAPLNGLQSNLGPLKEIKTRIEMNRELANNP